MIKSKPNLMSTVKLVIIYLMLTFFFDNVVFSETELDADYNITLQEKELDLSIDLNRLYDKTTRPNFSGVWVLDHSASDALKDVLKKVKPGKNGPPGGGNGLGRERGQDRKGRGKPEDMAGPKDESMRFGKEKMSAMLEKLLIDELIIIHNEPLFRVTMGRYATKRVYTDFRGSSVSALGGVEQSVNYAGWEGESLFIETTEYDEKKTNERFTILDSPTRLERIIEIPVSDQENKVIQIKQIYKLKNQSIKSFNNSSLFTFHF